MTFDPHLTFQVAKVFAMGAVVQRGVELSERDKTMIDGSPPAYSL